MEQPHGAVQAAQPGTAALHLDIYYQSCEGALFGKLRTRKQ